MERLSAFVLGGDFPLTPSGMWWLVRELERRGWKALYDGHEDAIYTDRPVPYHVLEELSARCPDSLFDVI